MSEIHKFPGAFVWKYEVPGNEAINHRLATLIREEAIKQQENTSYSWLRDGESAMVTNYWEQNSDAILQTNDVKEIVFGSVEKLISFLSDKLSLAESYKLNGLWWNHYPPGSEAPPHVHGSSAISAVYIIEQDEDCPIKFMCQNHYSLNPMDTGYSYQVAAGPGTCLMFPSALLHWVTPTKAHRTTLSFNFAAVV
jgi:hypothetical protein